MKIDKFVLSIILTIIMAYFFPQYGTASSVIPVGTIASIGISLIFFFYGLKLSASKISSGLTNWKLHILVQLTTFMIFPVLVILFYPLVNSPKQEMFWFAIFFMACLPSAVSSSVVMVALAKGNVPAAIFNASISGIIGILITPLWVGLFSHTATADFDFMDVYLKLVFEIILPVILGLTLQKYWGKFATRYTAQLTTFDKSVILLIIYKSFSTSFSEKVFNTVSYLDLGLLLCIVLSVFFLIFFLTYWFAIRLGFNDADCTVAQFCATKKSLIHGTVFSKVIFGASASTGFILLPIMLYHASQILLISIIARKRGNRQALQTME